ncbi:MAG: glycosyltransferase family 4 protein [Acidobacteria bacterium]|nr:glycosyltransferase family 4 protein [Acidobacteriota bacterium]MBU4307790.1 glycosyltransferase family 4 protein [Acidobacteriota bacterium]MCG2810397.1 glycosyltransferase family 4 protein [Candidatus Aminicenantes bacterium]
MKKRIWVVSELYYPEETSTGYFITGIAEGLARCHDVNVLCSQPTYSQRGVRAPAKEQRNGVSIKRCFGSTLDKNIIVFRLINLMTISFSLFLNALRCINRNDHVLMVTNPPLLPFFIALACRLRSAKCLLIIHDVYPEVMVVTGMIKADSYSAKFVNYLIRKLYLGVECIIVLGRDMRQLVCEKLAHSESRVVIIPNWGDINVVKPIPREKNNQLLTIKLDGQFVIQYSGNIGRTHGLEDLLTTALRLKAEPIHFLIIGSGAKRNLLEQAIQKEGLNNISLLPRVPRDKLNDSLNACDVAVISFVADMAGISVPSRMYNIMAAGKPIIAVAEENSELALVIKEEQIGWVVPPGDINRFNAAIQEARADSVQLAAKGIRARRAVEMKYSYECVIAAYHELFKNLGKLGA